MALVVCFSTICRVTDARVKKTWSYSDLFEKARFVVIVRPIATTDYLAGDPWVVFPGHQGSKDVTAVVTRCRVLSVLKGKIADNEIELPHYRFSALQPQIRNGPSLVQFALPTQQQLPENTKARTRHSIDIDALRVPGGRDYLLFLNQELDGDFTFVTGQFDSLHSVFRLRR